MLQITAGGTTVTLQEETLVLTIERGGAVWQTREADTPSLLCAEGTYRFTEAESITHETYTSGTATGIRSRFEGFGSAAELSFETVIRIEAVTGALFFDWIPLRENRMQIQRVLWPSSMEFEEPSDSWYTLLTHQQGMLIPNTWETALGKISFDGMYETAGGYMPWYGQVKDGAGYIAICETPWNAGYRAEHPEGGPYTHVGGWLEPSLGYMDYRRTYRYTFLTGCDYSDLCKVYRSYVNEHGKLRTLREKAIRNPSIHDLIGCAFVHTGIKTVVQPESDFFDPEHPEKNNHLTTFAQREKEIRMLHSHGVKKLYLHLDGWAQPGYDNQHPDYLPACREAGGYEGMRSLVDTMHSFGYLFGIHDQYRDYYYSAPSFDETYACRLPDGTIPTHSRWAGGKQSYLCATQAPYYVRRNFSELEANQISLDGAYLDVFTCNEGDECDHPEHRMTRRECYDYRGDCFEYLLSHGILSSSEEVSDWAIPHLIFCHYAPYDFMLRPANALRQGIPVPLFNLVYHDCVIEPWMMDRVSEEEDYMLYALINGGAPYLSRDGAYPDCDGAFGEQASHLLEEAIARCDIVSGLHERVACCELVRHELLTNDGTVQRSSFSDGTVVTVDFKKQTYTIA